MKINKSNPKHWYYLGLQAVFAVLAIILRPFLHGRNRPHIVILYGHQFSGHLAAIYEQWQSQDNAKLTLYYLSLDPSPRFTDAFPAPNVLHCSNLTDASILARASAVITDHGLHLMKPLVYFTDIMFFDVGHGIPFKGYDADTFTLQRRHYKEMWMSSEGLSEVYSRQCGCSHLVHSIGSPRTDRLLEKPLLNGTFRSRFNIPDTTTLILYAPTWQQDDAYRTLLPFDQSAGQFFNRFSEFCETQNCYLVFRSHLNASFPAKTYSRVAFCPQSAYPDTEGILLDTDILISDWSSIVFDFLVLDRPTIFLDVPHPFSKGCTLGPEYRFGHIVHSMDDLFTTLRTYVKSPRKYRDNCGDSHQSVKSFVYDNYADGKTSERCLKRLETLIL